MISDRWEISGARLVMTGDEHAVPGVRKVKLWLRDQVTAAAVKAWTHITA